MAHKKGGGSSRNGRDSAGQRLGIKKYGGEQVALASAWVSRNTAESKSSPVISSFGSTVPRSVPDWVLA